MKTLREHLYDCNGKFDYIKADELCLNFSNILNTEFNYTNQTRSALYRFSMLNLTYLDAFCLPDDFSIRSFFKLLHCEAGYEEFERTVFDCMMEKAMIADCAVYVFYEFYKPYKKHMPTDVYEFFFKAWEHVASVYDLEYDIDAARKWVEIERLKED